MSSVHMMEYLWNIFNQINQSKSHYTCTFSTNSFCSVFTVITIFIGVTLTGADAPEYVIYILAAYVAYQLLIELILEFHECFVVRINEGLLISKCLEKKTSEMFRSLEFSTIVIWLWMFFMTCVITFQLLLLILPLDQYCL